MIRTVLQCAGVIFVVTVVVALTGCGGSSAKAPGTVDGRQAGDGHEHGGEATPEHPVEGPHGGHLIELGNEAYHAELLHDETKDSVTVYVLDAAGTKPVAISRPEIVLQLFRDGKFVKYTLTGDQDSEALSGSASRFSIIDAKLCNALCHEEQISGRLQVTIDGTPYTGTIEHASHGDHDHAGQNHASHEH